MTPQFLYKMVIYNHYPGVKDPVVENCYFVIPNYETLQKHLKEKYRIKLDSKGTSVMRSKDLTRYIYVEHTNCEFLG